MAEHSVQNLTPVMSRFQSYSIIWQALLMELRLPNLQP